jgi:hypothetical protein
MRRESANECACAARVKAKLSGVAWRKSAAELSTIKLMYINGGIT